MKHNFTFLFFLSLTGFTYASAQAVSKSDSLALVDLYNNTKGSSWTNHDNWLTASPVCTWHGVTVSCNRVISIDLGVNNLDGKLPSSVNNLSALQYVYLYNNKLRSALPSFTGLISLKEFLIGNNYLTGSIPSSIGKLKNIEQFDLSHNRLSGSIPISIGSLTKAQYINLNNNKLTGKIPVTIGELAGIRILEMAGNGLSGNLPSEIGNLTSLQYLYVQNNKLNGEVPSAIGNLQSLQVMYIDDNDLSGPLTTAIGSLASLQLLSLNNNHLSGSLPASLGNLLNLSQLYISHNDLHGTIPSSLLKLTNLQYLYADHNHLSLEVNKTPVLPLNVSLHADISHNDFTFDGMEFVATHYPFVTYSPQASLSIHRSEETISLYAGGTLSNNSYTWYKVEDRSSMAFKGDSSFHPAAGGHYYAQVRNAMATQLVLTTDTFEYIVPSTDRSTTSLTQIKKESAFSFYPNPARDIVHISAGNNEVILLLDDGGKTLLSKTVSGHDVINISRFVPGTYYLHNSTTGATRTLLLVH